MNNRAGEVAAAAAAAGPVRSGREGERTEAVDLRGAYAVSDVCAESVVACDVVISLLMFPN